MTPPHAKIKQIFKTAVAAVDPLTSVTRALRDINRRGGIISSQVSDIYVIAVGKASAQMAAGASEALGERVASGIVVSKEMAQVRLPHFSYHVGAHPVPDNRSLEAGGAVLAFIDALPPDAQVICLISGGGSALVESLCAGYDLRDLQKVTERLLRAGAPIEELNAVRSRLSRIKGGGLLEALGERSVINLIVSDVLGDNLQVIASGPTVPPDESSNADEIVERYSLNIVLPAASEASVRPPVESLIIANLSIAIEAAADAAVSLGMRPQLLTDQLEGEAREAGRMVAEILKSSGHHLSPLRPGDCVLLGGETTVTVRGDGVGGRNTEAALAAAIELRDAPGLTVGFIATDGDDGTTGAAGAIVDDATISPVALEQARYALANNDSFGFLSGSGVVWSPGATGTNVNDLVIGLIE